MKIKVCGMKSPPNVDQVTALDINYIGFIFHEASPRCVDFNQALNVPDKIKKVGVFKNASFEFICDMFDKWQLDIVQLHGSESIALCRQLQQKRIPIIKAFGMQSVTDFQQMEVYQPYCKLFLLDTKCEKGGGSGLKFDWSILSAYPYRIPFMLSGGIGPNDAFNLIKPIHKLCVGVDINSCFEESPGIKNALLVKQFISILQSKKQNP